MMAPSAPPASAGARSRRASRGVLDALATRVRPVSLARDQQLPVLPALAPLVPGGALRRGTTVAVSSAAPGAEHAAGPRSAAGPQAAGHPGGATALALALAAGASRAGSWVAAVGLGSLGLVAAADYGVALRRLALVDDPEPRSWAAVVAALVDGFDVVLVAAGPQARRRPADARRLAARVRERGAVLVAVGGDLPERSRLQLAVTAGAWEGLDAGGYGHLSRRRVTVAAGGRGEAARPRRAELWLPAADGTVAPVEEVAPALPLTPRRPAASLASPMPGPPAGPGRQEEPARPRRRPPTTLRPTRVGAPAGVPTHSGAAS
jgi:hypothetical protein